MLQSPLKHCRACGTEVVYRVPDDGDDRERGVCPSCGTVHYQNPANIVGTLPHWGEDGAQVLLCLRNIEPRRGKWTLPAGFLEMGETVAEGAARETDEEAGAQIALQDLYTVMNVTRVGHVYLFYRARLLSTDFAPGHETIEARLFTEDQIPWEDLAFKTVRRALQLYFEDRRKGSYPVHVVDIA